MLENQLDVQLRSVSSQPQEDFSRFGLLFTTLRPMTDHIRINSCIADTETASFAAHTISPNLIGRRGRDVIWARPSARGALSRQGGEDRWLIYRQKIKGYCFGNLDYIGIPAKIHRAWGILFRRLPLLSDKELWPCFLCVKKKKDK